MPTLTMGIDLAAQPKDTAVCLLAWEEGHPSVVMLARSEAPAPNRTAFHDKWLSATAYGNLGHYPGPITKVGIDDPFGWPVDFLDAVAAYRDRPTWPATIDDPLKRFCFRETDRNVQKRVGKWPLSVASDRIAIPAMRLAVLLTDIALHLDDEEVARDGSGRCCEVYPDAALRLWTSDSANPLVGKASYKGADNAAKRAGLLEALTDQLPIADPDHQLDHVTDEDDYLDALVCALVARAVEVGLTRLPNAGREAELAAVEGWIHLPTSPLSSLAVDS